MLTHITTQQELSRWKKNILKAEEWATPPHLLGEGKVCNTANLPALEKVLVRDWLLAEAFPATTLPMGANPNNRLDFIENNIDMSGIADNNGGCCKTSEKDWPRTERYENGKVWGHSDYKNIAYQHVHEFYKRIRLETTR